MNYDYDMTVIGGGAAGLTAAGMAAVLGAKTALIEASKLGGDCTWYGCVPSKTLLHAAKVAHNMRTADRYGLTSASPVHDLARVMGHVHAIREHVYADADAPPNFEKLGVDVIEGRAAFVDPHTLAIVNHDNKSTITSRWIILATGSHPRTLEIQQDGSVQVYNNETIFDLQTLPKHLVVAGAGPIGVELASAFQRLGSEVTVVNHTPGILGRDDPELTTMLLDHLQREGIRFIFGAPITRLEHGVAITGTGERVSANAVLAAVGREPTLAGLNLEAAGVATNQRGIVVNNQCRSLVKNIYACGDVAGRHLFTHMAEHMAKIAVSNALLRIPASLDERHIVWCTYTDPELAHIGSHEMELQQHGVRYYVYRFPFTQLDRAITDSEETGVIKVLANRWGRILGVSILGANAGEMIGEYAVAMRNGIRLNRISSTIHPYPTYGLGNRRAADLYMIQKLTPRRVEWIRRLFRLHGDVRGITALSSENFS